MARVERLIAGRMTAPAGVWRAGDDLERPLSFPVPVYVIESGADTILIDTGLHPEAAADPAGRYDGAESLTFFALEQEASVAEQIELETVTMVVHGARRGAGTNRG